MFDVCCRWISIYVDGDVCMTCRLSRDDWLDSMNEVAFELMECEDYETSLKLMLEMDEYADKVRCFV